MYAFAMEHSQDGGKTWRPERTLVAIHIDHPSVVTAIHRSWEMERPSEDVRIFTNTSNQAERIKIRRLGSV